MTTRKGATTAPRQAVTPRPIDKGTVLRLHATTALTRLMRGEIKSAVELLDGLTPDDRAEIARAADTLAKEATRPEHAQSGAA